MRILKHRLGHLANALGDAEKRLLAVAPGGDGLGIGGKGLEAAQLRGCPVRRLEDHRNHPGFAAIVALEGPFHLDVGAIVGGQERSAHQHQDDVGSGEILIDRSRPFLPGHDLAIVPGLNHALSLQRGEMIIQGLAQLLVLVGVGDEEADWSDFRHQALRTTNEFLFKLASLAWMSITMGNAASVMPFGRHSDSPNTDPASMAWPQLR